MASISSLKSLRDLYETESEVNGEAHISSTVNSLLAKSMRGYSLHTERTKTLFSRIGLGNLFLILSYVQI